MYRRTKNPIYVIWLKSTDKVTLLQSKKKLGEKRAQYRNIVSYNKMYLNANELFFQVTNLKILCFDITYGVFFLWHLRWWEKIPGWVGIGEQTLNGSPVYEGQQVHNGTWETTWHSAFKPQTPGQTSTHLFRTQPLFEGQSVLTTHSGRQLSYGFPKYSGRQVQEPAPFCSLQTALAPQGDGIHGDVSSGFGAIIFWIL